MQRTGMIGKAGQSILGSSATGESLGKTSDWFDAPVGQGELENG